MSSEVRQHVFLCLWPREQKQELCSECKTHLGTIFSCPGIMERVGRANPNMTGSDKNKIVQLDQMNLPSVCPFVKSILGRARQLQRAKGRVMPGMCGWWLPASGGEGGTAALLQPDAVRMLGPGDPSSESPAVDDHYLLVL